MMLAGGQIYILKLVGTVQWATILLQHQYHTSEALAVIPYLLKDLHFILVQLTAY
jgi:hypothetical protein